MATTTTAPAGRAALISIVRVEPRKLATITLWLAAGGPVLRADPLRSVAASAQGDPLAACSRALPARFESLGWGTARREVFQAGI